MSRQIRKPSVPKKPAQERAENPAPLDVPPDALGPFATFSEWRGEADERAYAKL
jgi:hypothetical protein